MPTTTSVRPPSAADLNHEEFCQPQVRIDGSVGTVRVESFLSERINPATGQQSGRVRILRCLECGVQRNTTIEGNV